MEGDTDVRADSICVQLREIVVLTLDFELNDNLTNTKNLLSIPTIAF